MTTTDATIISLLCLVIINQLTQEKPKDRFDYIVNLFLTIGFLFIGIVISLNVILN